MVQWSKGCSVGISDIDKEHQQFFMIIAQLHDAMRQGKGHAIIRDILTELSEYTNHHFSTEENYFQKYKYPKANEHRKAHAEVKRRLVDFEERLLRGDAAVTIETLDFLIEYLREHIKKEDKEYADYFKKQRLL